MLIAEVLSDLTSLRVCDPAAALALVSASAAASPQTQTVAQASTAQAPQDASAETARAGDGGDEDLRRAKDLLALHAVFKKGGSGEGLVEELRGLRERVGRAMGGVGAEEVEVEDGEGFEEWN